MPASSGGSKISGSPAGSKPIFVRGEKHLPGNRKRTGEQGSFFWRKSVALRSRRRGGCETGRSGRLVENLADVSERIERDPAVEMERVVPGRQFRPSEERACGVGTTKRGKRSAKP